VKRIEFHAMGSRMHALLDADSAGAEQTLESVPVWFEGWEQALSRFRPGNELDRLNRSNGLPVAVSEPLWEVFLAAQNAEKFTGGLVTPAVLDALVLAGYNRSFDSLASIQPDAGYALCGAPAPCWAMVWDESTRSLVLPDNLHLDFGGVAKGWAADQAMRRLSEFGPALVNAGGDITISAPTRDGQPWSIGIDDPFQEGAFFETLKLEAGGVATSGRDYHRWLKDGVWHHHIIDPRSGLPADTDVMTATVVAPTLMEAEAAAKAVLILGSLAGLDWLESDSALAGVLVLENGNSLYSAGMEKYLWRN
jgi:thiamine biosynthesis lipoprotein